MFENVINKPLRRIVGLMSGTSADGIDAALVEIEGTEDLKVSLRAFENVPYPSEVRSKIFELFNPEQSTVDKIGFMNFLLGELFAEAALLVIRKAGLSPSDIDLIGSHGQTIYHHPQIHSFQGHDIRYTVQIGEGAVISARTGIPCVSDFRVADMAVGGQGAPLVPFTEYLLYRSSTKNMLLLNIGGIGNITVIPANCEASQVFAFDTGPGNMVIDGLVNKLYNGALTMDEGGKIAGNGKINQELVDILISDTYFSVKPPKSTGREHFGAGFISRVLQIIDNKNISREDAIATVTYLTAWSVGDAYCRFIDKRCKADTLIIGGGGSYNRTLVEFIRNEMAFYGIETYTQEQIGFNSDAKEAVAFAVLADRTIAGKVNVLPNVTGAKKASVMGKISL
jgi:anhydro-N-acetylmuramic acid kinase